MDKLTDAIQNFIRLADDYLAKNDAFLIIYRQLMQPQGGSPSVIDTLSSALPGLSKELEDVRQQIIASGKKLANNIAATAGGDVRSLLQFINVIDKPRRVDSLDVETVMDTAYDLWENLKPELQTINLRGSLPEVDDNSAWVPATHLWQDRFSNFKKMGKLREKHPEMFRNPSTYKLEIHAGKWAAYWATADRDGFEKFDDDLPSIADDPNVRGHVIRAAVERVAELRKNKKRGKQ